MDNKHSRLMTSYVVCIAMLFGFPGGAFAHEDDRLHAHVGGPLEKRPFSWTMQTWYKDIVYDASSHDLNQTSLDIYTAQPARTNAPVMVFFHGGGLVFGDKAARKDLGHKPEFFANKLGYVFVSANYRLLPEGLHPTNVQDAANAVAWVHNNIENFGGDPDQIFIMGYSSASELAVRLGTDPVFLNEAGKSINVVKGVIANDGIYGVPGDEPPDPARMLMRYGPIWPDIAVVSRVSRTANIPPFLIFYVPNTVELFGADTKKQSLGLAEALRAVEAQVEVARMEHVDHVGVNERMGEPGDRLNVPVERFLNSVTGNTQPAQWPAARPPARPER